MKIVNEKGLQHLATSDYQTDKEGYLYKKTELAKGFHKRWFVLKGNMLFYFGKKGEREPLGVIILEGYTVELTEGENDFVFAINFIGVPSRTYYLSADSQESMESWMKALSCASYDFMKLKIMELQSQIEELSLTGVHLVEAAVKDGQLLGHVYAAGIATSSFCKRNHTLTTSLTTSGTHVLHVPFVSCSQVDDICCPVLTVPPVEVVTWSVLGMYSFTDMHDFVKQQMDQFDSQST